ncbi:MAG: hypothetical protein ACRCXX_07360 [Cetobacterium sp.]|uniref:hypothetical protein n=1 Tax=Cetobacterium sp. TaxID=2071632 RepID=UPI003F2B1555
MARNIQLLSKSFKISEKVAVELANLVFGGTSQCPEAWAQFRHFDKLIIDSLRESIDPEWKDSKELKEEDKNPLEENKEVIKDEDKKPLNENSQSGIEIIRSYAPFRFGKKDGVNKDIEKTICEAVTSIDTDISKLKDVLGDDPRFNKAIDNLSKTIKELKEEDKNPLEEKESKEDKNPLEEFKPVTPDEVANVLENIITKSIKNIPVETVEYLNGVFDGIKKLDFSKIKSNDEFDKKINTTLLKLVDPISASVDAAGYIVNKDVLKEQFYKTADGIIDPIVLTKKSVYNPKTSLNRIVSAFDMDADVAKELRKDLKSCISGMSFQNVDEFKNNAIEQHEQVFAPIYDKYSLQENLKYAYENSKDNPFELAIEIKEMSSDDIPEDSFVVGEEVSHEELSAQINNVLESGAGEVIVTKPWKRKGTAKK